MKRTFVSKAGEAMTYREWQKAMGPRALREAMASGEIVAMDASDPRTEPRRAVQARKRAAEAVGASVTDLQLKVLVSLMSMSGDGPARARAVADRAGLDVYVTSGVLSSLVERGMAWSSKVKGGSAYVLTMDGKRALTWGTR
jgi:predicted transcriptional regulator